MKSRLWGKNISEPPKPEFSSLSTPSVPDSLWLASDFLLGAGMVIIQPETEKIVVINDTKTNNWFLPKGRKDVGESLEQAALREAYEESGYKVDFLPLHNPTRAPKPPNTSSADPEQPNTEPIYVSLAAWTARHGKDCGGEYLSFYYVGRLAVDAVHNEGTGMPDELNYKSHLLSVDEAMEKLKGFTEMWVVSQAWELWLLTSRIEETRKKKSEVDELVGSSTALSLE